MSHEIENNLAFFVKEPAWHKLGTVLTDAPTPEEAWKLAYPFELFKLDCTAHIDGETLPLDNMKAIIRSDGKEIAHVNRSYELVQPYTSFNAFNELITSDLVTLEAGGSLNGGTRMWALTKVKNATKEIVKGDAVHAYVLLFNSFDGSLNLGYGTTSVRVVCANTLAMAQGEQKGNRSKQTSFKFRHTKNVHTKLAAAEVVIGEVLQNHNKSIEAYKKLARTEQTVKEQITYIQSVFEYDDTDEDNKPSKQLETKVSRVIELLDTQSGYDLVPAMRGTAWQSYNAVSQYLTHEQGRTPETRLNSQWFGAGKTTNSRALELALAL